MDTGYIIKPPVDRIFGVPADNFEIQVPFKMIKPLCRTFEALPFVLPDDCHYRISYCRKAPDSAFVLLEPADNKNGIEGKIVREEGKHYHDIASLGVHVENGKRYGVLKITKGENLEEPAVSLMNIRLKHR